MLIALHDLNLAAGTVLTDDIVTPDALRTVYRVDVQFLTCHAATQVIVPLSGAEVAQVRETGWCVRQRALPFLPSMAAIPEHASTSGKAAERRMPTVV
ncbi:hypothetical protein [Rhizobium sp. 18065]|uniref:hypothetical protein n=1 Tax=Rhizobium sp. 18065 TaxID=2681411 RepID=UPI00135B5638|nr:hypothetical protein [Rhizobium sp. 18065]